MGGGRRLANHRSLSTVSVPAAATPGAHWPRAALRMLRALPRAAGGGARRASGRRAASAAPSACCGAVAAASRYAREPGRPYPRHLPRPALPARGRSARGGTELQAGTQRAARSAPFRPPLHIAPRAWSPPGRGYRAAARPPAPSRGSRPAARRLRTRAPGRAGTRCGSRLAGPAAAPAAARAERGGGGVAMGTGSGAPPLWGPGGQHWSAPRRPRGSLASASAVRCWWPWFCAIPPGWSGTEGNGGSPRQGV